MKKRFLSMMLILTMLFGIVPNFVARSFVWADEVDVVKITTADELVNLANASWSDQEELWSKTYELTNDIDMEDVTITDKKMKPIGSSSKSFTGTFDGKGHTIKNLEFQVTNGNGGLFHTLSKTATVKNLRLENANLKLYGDSGALAGKNSGKIEDCSVINSTIAATSSTVGGIVGINEGIIEKSFIDNSIVKYDNTYSTTTYGSRWL